MNLKFFIGAFFGLSIINTVMGETCSKATYDSMVNYVKYVSTEEAITKEETYRDESARIFNNINGSCSAFAAEAGVMYAKEISQTSSEEQKKSFLIFAMILDRKDTINEDFLSSFISKAAERIKFLDTSKNRLFGLMGHDKVFGFFEMADAFVTLVEELPYKKSDAQAMINYVKMYDSKRLGVAKIGALYDRIFAIQGSVRVQDEVIIDNNQQEIQPEPYIPEPVVVQKTPVKPKPKPSKWKIKKIAHATSARDCSVLLRKHGGDTAYNFNSCFPAITYTEDSFGNRLNVACSQGQEELIVFLTLNSGNFTLYSVEDVSNLILEVSKGNKMRPYELGEGVKIQRLKALAPKELMSVGLETGLRMANSVRAIVITEEGHRPNPSTGQVASGNLVLNFSLQGSQKNIDEVKYHCNPDSMPADYEPTLVNDEKTFWLD